MACLLGSILAAWDGLGPHFGGLGRHRGHGLDPELSQGRQNELNCTPVQAGAPISEAPGIQGTAKVGGDLGACWPYYVTMN